MKVFAILLLIGVLLLEARAVVTGRVIEKGRFEWEASGAVALKRSGTAYYEQENLWVGGRYYLNMGPLNETPLDTSLTLPAPRGSGGNFFGPGIQPGRHHFQGATAGTSSDSGFAMLLVGKPSFWVSDSGSLSIVREGRQTRGEFKIYFTNLNPGPERVLVTGWFTYP